MPTINGTSGDDTLYGNNASDTLDGGAGDDTLFGMGGADSLTGGPGHDVLYGGDGNDIYVIHDVQDRIIETDTGGTDTTYVYANFVKLPSTVESVVYMNGAQALPYWIDALLGDDAAGDYYRWLLGDTLTYFYTFPASLPSYNNQPDDGTGYTQLNAGQITQVETALSYVSSITALTFTRTETANALNTLSFAYNTQTNSGAYAYLPGNYALASDVFFNNAWYNATLSPGTYGAYVLMHELGHAIGMKHPFEVADAGGYAGDPPYLPDAEDTSQWTFMSYTYRASEYALRYSDFDIATLQYLYGVNSSSRSGNDTYIISESAPNFVWDGSGTDTLSLASASQSATAYLTPGYWGYLGSTRANNISAAGQITVNFGSVIENLVGSAFADQLFGNSTHNRIEGGAGNDVIEGGSGIDVAIYSGTRSQYNISRTASGYQVQSISGTDGTDQLSGIETLQFSGGATYSLSANNPPAGTVQIINNSSADRGTTSPQQGDVLSLSQNLDDADGLGTLSYQWLADGQAIANATGTSFTTTQAQVGQALSVRVSYTDGQGAPETVSSNATTALVNVNDMPAGRLNITGTPTQGQTLHAQVAFTDADGLGTLSYQWMANGQAIAGATTNSLVLGQAQVGQVISVQASYLDGYGRQETVQSGLFGQKAITAVGFATGARLPLLSGEGGTLTYALGVNNVNYDSYALWLTGNGTLNWLGVAEPAGWGGTSANLLDAARINGDVHTDLIARDASGNIVSFLLDGTWTPYNSTGSPYLPAAVSSGLSGNYLGNADIDGDGRTDLLLSYSNDIRVFWGLGNGAFTYNSHFLSAQASPDVLQHRDLNNDNRLDLVVTSGSITEVFLGNGSGGFARSATLSTSQLHSVSLAHFNTGSVPDLLINGRVYLGNGSGQYTAGSSIAVPNGRSVTSSATSDFNGDGHTDVALGLDQQGIIVALGNGAGGFLTQDRLNTDLSFAVNTLAVADMDRDGDLDLLASGPNSGTRVYINTGGGLSTTVQDINDAPTGTPSLLGQVRQGSTLTIEANDLADADGINNATLAYTWLADGTVISGAMGNSFTPTQAQVGRAITARISYSDNGGYSNTILTTATTTVADLNDAPTAIPSAKTTNEDTPVLLMGTDFGFSDALDAGGLGTAHTLLGVRIDTLPSATIGNLRLNGIAVTAGQIITASSLVNSTSTGLVFVPATHANGLATFTFSVRDNGGTTNGGVDWSANAATMTLTVNAVNDAPTVANPLSARSTSEDQAFSWVVPANIFNDVDVGDTLTYTATLASGVALPSWLSFTPATRTFSGTPANSDVGTLSVRITATDGSGATASSSFVLMVANTNDAPTVTQALVNQAATEDSAFSYTFDTNTFNDVDVGDTLTYSATLTGGTALPTWLSFNASTRTFSGNPANGDVGTLSVRITATDGSGDNVSSTFTVAVANVNDAPTVANPLSARSTPEDQAFSWVVPANTFNDVDVGDTLTYTATLASGVALPSWLSFTPATRTFNGTPANNDVGTLSVRVTATDGSGSTANSTFALTVTNTNDPPTVATPLVVQGATEDSAFSYTFDTNTFNDVDVGDTLTYTATLASGAALPSWLSFTPATRTFSGTPANSDVGTLSVRITATDASGSTANSTFALSVANVNDAPTVSGALINQSAIEDAVFSYTFAASTFNDVDVGDTLNLTAKLASGAALPSWLSFDPATRTFSGTPTNSNVGTLSVRITATDASGSSASNTFSLEVANTNDAPTLANALVSQAVTEDSAFSYSFAINTFNDVDVGDTLTYSATLGSGAALPDWLTFVPATRTFSGTPANGDVGTLSVLVTATDGSGSSASNTFSLEVANTNDAPTVANALVNLAATEDSLFSYTFDTNTFNDVDVGDTLTLSATLTGGTALPTWLSFNAGTRTFSGTPANGDVGTLSVRVTATDGSGATASSTFALEVANVNDAPTVSGALINQSAIEDAVFSYTFAASTFNDVDVGDTLNLTATLASGAALPSWLSFTPATRTFSGTPANGDVGTLSVRITATDGSGATASSTFNVGVANVNDAPTVANPLSGRSTPEDQAFSWVVPANTFNDVDVGDTLTYTATLVSGTALPNWLSFNASTRTFSGTPANGDMGNITVKVTATDGSGSSASNTFSLEVANTNDAPTVANALVNLAATEDSLFSYTFDTNTFNDVDVGDTLTYTATLVSGTALPNWLSFNASTRTFSGTPANGDMGNITVKVTATDGSGASASNTFSLEVANTNDAPTLANALVNQAATEDSAFSYSFDTNTFNDVDVGDTLTYSASLTGGAALPTWLTFTSGSKTFSGTPANGDVGTLSVRVTATDGSGATTSNTFALTVANTNDAPTVAQALVNQAAIEDSAFNWVVPANTFTDVDVGDTLNLTATLASGAALPSWLAFNAGTRTFSGTPANSDVSTLSVRVTATDSSGATASSTFALSVANVNDAPTVTNPLVGQSATEDDSFTYTFAANTFNDVDLADTLTYSATLGSGAALPTWLSFNAGTRTFSGTPANGDVGTLSVLVTATDSSGATASSFSALTVTNTNDPPTVASALIHQSATEDAAFNYIFAANSFADVDVGDTLTYTATLVSGTALPNWLSFNASTRTFSGTPANGDVGNITVKVTATDGSGSTANSTFALEVANTNDAPTVANALVNLAATEDSAFSYTIAINTFNDVDVGDTLTYSATLGSGAALPDWLTFVPATRTFSGTPANGDVGTLSVRITATDGSGSTASSTFALEVANTNDAPTVINAIADRSIAQGGTLVFSLANDTFNDVDAGDALSYSATLASDATLPTWLTFNPVTRTFSGTPANDDVGSYAIKVIATDLSGAIGEDFYTLTVSDVNDPPTVASALIHQSATEDAAFNYIFAANSFADVDVGDTLTFSATLVSGTALPNWLSFNASTRTFSGAPANSDVGTLSVRITATDGSGATASSTFNVGVANVNDAPTVTIALSARSTPEDQSFSWVVPANTFNDADVGDTLTYSATLTGGAALPTWLSFTPATRTFSGTPANGDVGTLSVRITASDSLGATASSSFALMVANTNDAPTVTQALVNQAATEDRAFSYTFAINTFNDVDVGDTLTYTATLASGAALPNWLGFEAGTRTFSGTPENAHVGNISVRVKATDGTEASVSSIFALNVANTNDAPTWQVAPAFAQTTLSTALTGATGSGTAIFGIVTDDLDRDPLTVELDALSAQYLLLQSETVRKTSTVYLRPGIGLQDFLNALGSAQSQFTLAINDGTVTTNATIHLDNSADADIVLVNPTATPALTMTNPAPLTITTADAVVYQPVVQGTPAAPVSYSLSGSDAAFFRIKDPLIGAITIAPQALIDQDFLMRSAYDLQLNAAFVAIGQTATKTQTFQIDRPEVDTTPLGLTVVATTSTGQNAPQSEVNLVETRPEPNIIPAGVKMPFGSTALTLISSAGQMPTELNFSIYLPEGNSSPVNGFWTVVNGELINLASSASGGHIDTSGPQTRLDIHLDASLVAELTENGVQSVTLHAAVAEVQLGALGANPLQVSDLFWQ